MREYGLQLPLPMDLPVHCEFDNFLSSAENRILVRHLRNLNGATPEHARQVLLWGERGVGKTHLLQAVCHASIDSGVRAAWVPMREAVSQGSGVLQGLETIHIVCLDDVDAVGGDSEWQLALFRLINDLRARRNILLMSSRESPRCMNALMRDLSSRMLWGTVHHVRALSENDLEKAMQTYALARHIVLPQQVARYLIGTFPRDLATMTAWIDRLGDSARARRRNVTIPLVKELLGSDPGLSA